MPFNYDFRRDLSRYRHLDAASTPGNSSYLSTTLSSLASHDSASSYLSGPLDEYFKEPLVKEEEERYVQPGIRDIKIIEKYLLRELEVPVEVVFTWLPGYTPKREKKEEPMTRAISRQISKLEIEVPRRNSQSCLPKKTIGQGNQKPTQLSSLADTPLKDQTREKPTRRATYVPEKKITATSTPLKRISLPNNQKKMETPRNPTTNVSSYEEKPTKKETHRLNQTLCSENIQKKHQKVLPIPARRSSDICVPQKEILETPVRRSSAYTYVLRIVPTP